MQGGLVRRRAQDGQTLVEFAMVIPIFLTILISIVEFAFMFNAILATDFVSRDAALVAAEAGDQVGADCVILASVDADMGAPAGRTQIQSVEIYRTNAAGTQQGSATIYERRSSFDCVLPDGSTATIHYTRTQNGYPETSRCNVLAGCGGQPLDHVAVKVTYRYVYKTPIGASFGPYLTVVRSNSMRMEPIL
jgi:Flp pilus assembly protein TadG